MRDAALTFALKKVGGPSALARHFGISPSAVIQWDRVPPGRVLDVERFTGVSRHDLRPDIYGPDPALAASGGAERPEDIPTEPLDDPPPTSSRVASRLNLATHSTEEAMT